MLWKSLLNYVPYVFSCPPCFALYMLSCLTCLLPYMLSCPTCLLPSYVLLWLACLVATCSGPNVPVTSVPLCLTYSCASRALCLTWCRASHVLCNLMPRVFCDLRFLVLPMSRVVDAFLFPIPHLLQVFQA